MDNQFDLASSPVMSLQRNILWQFENTSSSGHVRLRALVENGLLSNEILLDMAANTPLGPKVSLQDAPARAPKEVAATIHLQVAYLEVLWASIFGWMILFEEGVQRRWLDKTYQPDASLLGRAELLLQWADSQRNEYKRWPLHLPSPIQYADSVEKSYGEKANLVFQKAVAFLLGHESAHAALGHLEIVRNGAPDALRLELEKDADVAALEELLSPGLDDKEKAAEAWAILSVVLSTLYLFKDPRGALRSSTHPPVHHRVAHFVEALAMQAEQYDHYFKLLAYVALRSVFPKVLVPEGQFDDAEDALEDALNRLDAYAR